jgi:DNA-binding CsgD family transcriptional regulator
VLIGRESHCARLDELLERARTGRSGALAIRGEAGIGKTALLDYAIERAEGATVVRALGVESEAELQFSGLLEVCWPLRDRLEEIADHQAEVLRAALGLGPAEAHDRFSVGAATLGLLAASAETNPLLVVDDAQWLDRSSQDALLFAVRRLEADRVAVLFAAREGEERTFEAPGIESISLTGLAREAANRLLVENGQGGLAREVANRLCEATGGNPLALIELPSLLSAEQLAGSAPIGDPLPAGSSVERAFARCAEALPESARRALLVAAVSSSSELETVVGGVAALGLGAEALEAAEDAGLVRFVDGRLVFGHPLVRSAVYHAAAASDRRAVHRALADALVGSPHTEARAWHLAGAALGPDERAAEALAQAAEHARRQSGYAAAAAALERAARLSPDGAVGVERLAAAADAAWRAGRTETASRLVAETLARVGDPRVRAETLRLHGAIEFFAGRGDAAAAALLDAVTLLEAFDHAGAVAAAADAVNALVRVRQPALALETAQRARSLAPSNGGEADAEATIALGYALCFAGRYGEAEPHLRRAVELFSASTSVPSPLQAGRLSAALGWLGRHQDAHAYLAATVARARAAGAVGSLPHLLASSAWQALHASRWNQAHADAGEAVELAAEVDQPVTATQALGVLTWLHALRGDEARCRACADETQRRARGFGFRLYELLASLCLGLLDLGAGRVDDAIGTLEDVARHADERGLYIPGVSPQLELAEAHLRAGRAAAAEAILASFERSELVSAPLPSALAARCRGLLARADRFEPHFDEALALHARVQSPFALARTRLCYGERLRRAGRRIDAREQLRAARETFERIGAEPWAERARGELRASGETLRRRDPSEAEELTPQELQIALQVAGGKTNKEVGAALFLSHKTVEFHLSRVYRKLDTRSRAELIRHFATDPVLALTCGSQVDKLSAG